LNLFGFPPTEAVVQAIPRSRSWRSVRASVFFGGGLLLAPVVGLVPPHAPWVAGVLGFGIFFGLRKWREHFTVESLQARCPKCGEPVGVKAGTPMRNALSVSCDACHHDSQLSVQIPSNPDPPGSSYGPTTASPGSPGTDAGEKT